MMYRMTSVLTVAVVLSAASFNGGFAQDKASRFGVRLGGNVGLNNVQFVGMNREVRFGLVAGGIFEYWLSPRFAIHTNALYNMKGAQWGVSVPGIASADAIWKFDYLSIPTLGKIAFGERTKLYLLIGPEFGFLLSGKQVVEATGLGMQADEEIDLKDYMNSFEVAVASGLGVEIPMGNAVFFIESRGSLSLTDIFKEIHPDITIEDKAVRNVVSSLSIGVAF